MKKFILLTIAVASLSAHCQMPCGIYNDQMVYDQINQYYLTVYKGVKVMENNKLQNADDYNKMIRWVNVKDKLSDDTAHLITTFFLQQKIAPIPDNTELVCSLHKLLFLLVAIKQNVDLKIVQEFGDEWQHFKDLFHPELECRATPTSSSPANSAPSKGDDAKTSPKAASK